MQSPSDPPPLLRLERLGHRYVGGVAALDDVSLTVPAGAFVALLGPSGCGKSTLLRLAAGLATPTAGELHVAQGGTTGFVFQSPTLMPWATVADNVALPLRIAGVASAARRARALALLDGVGLGGFADAHPDQLSGGMQMRASIARALVTQPALLLMDEPFAALDEITRQRLGDDLLALWHRQRFTVLFVTHSVFEAVYLSQRVVVMSARPGRIVDDIAIEAGVRDRAWRGSPGYASLCARVSAALEAAMAA